MNAHNPASGSRWPGLLTQLAVIAVVVALAGATFVLSYAGVHAIAVAAGVPRALARLYPAIFDAVLVVACTAALTLRGATPWARLYPWLSIIVLVAVIGTADAIHAMGIALPHRQTAGTVAALPWALVMLGFSLWLTMLRHTRAQQPAEKTPPAEARRTEENAAAVAETAIEAQAASKASTAPETVAAAGTPEEAPASAEAPKDGQARPEAPLATHFRRVRSTPTPPED
ncbi:MAG: DUF2637 domain-containing protein [Streptosporangiaceae bacterium]|nr:DUF2637 domain-containing protein [Streptosporangiaceae bacterium]MBV9856179.1 DUF2637 domain-containing protein [Streptosporangiaceae bacterium]